MHMHTYVENEKYYRIHVVRVPNVPGQPCEKTIDWYTNRISPVEKCLYRLSEKLIILSILSTTFPTIIYTESKFEFSKFEMKITATNINLISLFYYNRKSLPFIVMPNNINTYNDFCNTRLINQILYNLYLYICI